MNLLTGLLNNDPLILLAVVFILLRACPRKVRR